MTTTTTDRADHQRRALVARAEDARTDMHDLRSTLTAARAAVGEDHEELFDRLEEAAERLGGLDLHFGCALPALERVAEETSMATAWRDDADLARAKLDGALEELDAVEDAFDAAIEAAA